MIEEKTGWKLTKRLLVEVKNCREIVNRLLVDGKKTGGGLLGNFGGNFEGNEEMWES